ncbi:Butirosin biosynthesis, BtrG-like protein [Cyathus striatus]|nr:Butirosin biosynthesis, BtrG-like protein [Cyathus striatus]
MTLPGWTRPDAHPVIYFGYGSNIWLDQMNRRCPESKFIGIAVLQDWKWIINGRGYANIIPTPGDIVYGSVYELSPSDESSLDRYEGVPKYYGKQTLSVNFTSTTGEEKVVDTLVYVDEHDVVPGEPKAEYIDRMNWAIVDGVKCGIPRAYIQKYIRPFIRADSEEDLQESV